MSIVLEDRIGFWFGLQLVNVRLSTSVRVIHGFAQNNGLELLGDSRPNFLGIVVKLGPLFASHEDTFVYLPRGRMDVYDWRLRVHRTYR